MPSLAERQRDFAAAIRAPARPVPHGLAGPAGTVREDRFAVYRNNVAVSLVEALRSAFPVVERLVGADFFTAMARAHVLETPPASPVMLAYGHDFPGFVAAFEPARAVPYLADVARLEWLWLEAYHAADALPLTMADLQRQAGADLPDLRLALHPSARLARFDWPALTIWRHQQSDGDAGPLEIDDAAQEALLVRPHAQVEAMALPPGGHAFLTALQQGTTVSEATALALEAVSDFDLAALMSLAIGAGAFVLFHDTEQEAGMHRNHRA